MMYGHIDAREIENLRVEMKQLSDSIDLITRVLQGDVLHSLAAGVQSVTVAECAELLAVSKETVHDHLIELCGYKLGGRYRIPLKAISALQLRQRVGGSFLAKSPKPWHRKAKKKLGLKAGTEATEQGDSDR